MTENDPRTYLTNLAEHADPKAWSIMLKFWNQHYGKLHHQRFYRISGMLARMHPDFPERARLEAIFSKLVNLYEYMERTMPRFVADTVSLDEQYKSFDAAQAKNFEVVSGIPAKVEAAKLAAARKRQQAVEQGLDIIRHG